MKISFNKIILIIIVLTIVLNILSISIYASDVEPITMDKIENNIKSFKDHSVPSPDQKTIDTDQMKTMIRPIAGILTLIGDGILIVITMVMGIKYMTASPDQQAKIKVQMVGLVVSAIVIFGAYEIWKMAYDFMNKTVG